MPLPDCDFVSDYEALLDENTPAPGRTWRLYHRMLSDWPKGQSPDEIKDQIAKNIVAAVPPEGSA